MSADTQEKPNLGKQDQKDQDSVAPPPIQIRVQGRTVVLRESEPLTGAEWDKMLDILRMLRPDD